MSRTARSCACKAIQTIRTRRGSPAGRSTATPTSLTPPSASRRRSSAPAPRASGQFTPITWDQALDEITAKWKAIIAESGPLALLGYAYSAHQGLMNRGLVNGLFHALGASRLHGRHGLRHLLRDGVGNDGRPRRRRRSRGCRPFRPGDLVGCGPRRHQRAFLGARRGAEEEARRADRGDRSAPHAQRQGGRPLSADPHRHRCRAGARHHAHPGARQARRPRLHRQAHAGLRQGRARDPAEVRAAARRRDHRACRCRHREARGDVRQGQGRDDPAGRRHDATDAWRPGAAHRGAAAGRVGPLCRAGRRRAAADRGVVRPQLRRHPQALGAGRDAQRQSPAPGRRASEHEGPADPRALRVGQQSRR